MTGVQTCALPISILHNIVSMPTEIRRAATTVPGFVKQWGLSSELGGYIQERVNKFAADHVSEQATVTEDN